MTRPATHKSAEADGLSEPANASLAFLVDALQDFAIAAAHGGILIEIQFLINDLVEAQFGIMRLYFRQDVLRLLDVAKFEMADDKSDERPPRHSRHFRVAGNRLSISSSRSQYDAAKVFIPPYRIWVATLGFDYFTKPFLRPIGVAEEKSTDTQDERIVRIEWVAQSKNVGTPIPYSQRNPRAQHCYAMASVGNRAALDCRKTDFYWVWTQNPDRAMINYHLMWRNARRVECPVRPARNPENPISRVRSTHIAANSTTHSVLSPTSHPAATACEGAV